MNDIKKLLGKRIKEIRKYKGWSQEQLAEYANIDQRNISNIECGVTFPSRALLNITNALDIELPELFDFEHLDKTSENMQSYITKNIKELSENDLKTVYRLIKSMR